MINRIQVLNYRSLGYIDVGLNHFNMLIGPNASGKSTLVDVLLFIRDLLRDGLEKAVYSRSPDFRDLVFNQEGNCFEIALEMPLPDDYLHEDGKPRDTARYQIAVGLDESSNQLAIFHENLIYYKAVEQDQEQLTIFPQLCREVPSTLKMNTRSNHECPNGKSIINKKYGGNDTFQSELKRKGQWIPSFRLGPMRSAWANMPDDPEHLVIARDLRSIFTEKLRFLVLNSEKIRKSSPPGLGLDFLVDGSNLPWVIKNLKDTYPDRFEEWLAQIQTALPEILGIDLQENKEDRSLYLRLHLSQGISIPSWTVSDGTLRMLALTLPPFLTDFDGLYLIEEPENGIHPKAIETVYQCLEGLGKAQVFLATHSVVMLRLGTPSQMLCFAKDDAGSVQVVRGDRHPGLQDWQQGTDLGLLFAAGVLG